MKLTIGNYNNLTISKETPQGLYLNSSEGEILLPKKFIPQNYKIGETIEVFVYTDSEDRLVATTQQPRVTVDEFGALEVKDVTRYGAFLDWGLDKDLLLPYKEQAYPVKAGEQVVIRASLDHRTQRVIAVSKIESFLEKDTSQLEPGQAVELLVYDRTPLGFKVVVDQKYGGMLYHNEIFQPVQTGESASGFIKKIREDGKLDITLQPAGVQAIPDAKDQVLNQLQDAGGFLPFHDRSSPEDIKNTFHMSKKAFKKALGGLYKEKKINITDQGVYLL